MESFVYTEEYEFDWPVEVEMPGDNGQFVKFHFTARFRVLDEEKILTKLDAESLAEVISGEVDRLSDALVGWSGIAVKGGGELLYSEEVKANLLRQRHVRIGVGRAYFDAMINGGQKEKN